MEVSEPSRAVPSTTNGNGIRGNLLRGGATATLLQIIRWSRRGRGGPGVGDLGSGSDYTPFIQHLGVPSTDVGSTGPYGVYHSAFDNYAWFLLNADPTFAYEQQMARIFGLEAIHMADTDVLPYDYVTYARQIQAYLYAAQARAREAGLAGIDFNAAIGAANRFTAAAAAVFSRQLSANGNSTALNTSLRAVEEDFLSPQGLPGPASWFRHTISAPGEYTGYLAAVVIPGVNEAI